MNIFFDVDGTIIADDNNLRPHVREVFQKLKEAGHTIYVWSGVGIRWEIVRANNLEAYVTDCYLKPISDHMNSLAENGIKVHPDFCVDDYESVVQPFGGVAVKPYFFADSQDKEMLRVLEAALNHKKDTHNTNPYYS